MAATTAIEDNKGLELLDASNVAASAAAAASCDSQQQQENNNNFVTEEAVYIEDRVSFLCFTWRRKKRDVTRHHATKTPQQMEPPPSIRH